MQYKIKLAAGVPTRQEFSGITLVLLDLGAALSIDMAVEVTGFAVEEFRAVKEGLKLQGNRFTAAKFTSTVDTTIEVIVSDSNMSVNYTDGATVNAVITGPLPLPVQPNRGGDAGTPVYVSGVMYNDVPAASMLNTAAVACTSVEAVLVTANAARKGVRFTNIGTDPAAIGAAGITWAKRCVILNSGDTWVEERAANLAFSAICDAAKTASVTVQEVLS